MHLHGSLKSSGVAAARPAGRCSAAGRGWRSRHRVDFIIERPARAAATLAVGAAHGDCEHWDLSVLCASGRPSRGRAWRARGPWSSVCAAARITVAHYAHYGDSHYASWRSVAVVLPMVAPTSRFSTS